MFYRLKERWKVGGVDLALILTTFAFTGTFTAWLTRKITSWVYVEKWSTEWIILKFIVLLFGYQFFILFFGGLLGQFSFFWNYEKKILARMGLLRKKLEERINLAVFASGTGTNFKRIAEYFKNHKKISVSLLVCNNPEAGVISISREKGIPICLISREDLQHPEILKGVLQKNKIDYIVLAGFLKKIPPALIEAYPRRIVNIHPALLPKFGGKGMYGNNVHDAVIKSGETKSGITIHFVDEHYDSGDVIFQKDCAIEKVETPETLAKKIHKLEHDYYAPQIEALINMQNAG
jgi:folate-dependent phosphoribosylglycinamide formyltransferase PurN